MNSTTLFGMALGLQSPWQVNDVSFAADDAAHKELHLHIGFERGARFPDETDAECPVHDTVAREWQHLNFFEHHCFLHCAVPRIKTTSGKVQTVSVPWARAESGFTLMFEAFAMALIEREMPVNRVAE
ncbi:MAG: ISL3 family transposase, partial [Gallionella sp.]